MGSRVPLARLEEIIDGSGVAPAIEALLPAGVRHRQLRARTMLLGMQLALDDRRPACLTEIHAALTSLPDADQARLGVTEDWHGRPHQLTYRQTERTFGLVVKALSTVTGFAVDASLLEKVASEPGVTFWPGMSLADTRPTGQVVPGVEAA